MSQFPIYRSGWFIREGFICRDCLKGSRSSAKVRAKDRRPYSAAATAIAHDAESHQPPSASGRPVVPSPQASHENKLVSLQLKRQLRKATGQESPQIPGRSGAPPLGSGDESSQASLRLQRQHDAYLKFLPSSSQQSTPVSNLSLSALATLRAGVGVVRAHPTPSSVSAGHPNSQSSSAKITKALEELRDTSSARTVKLARSKSRRRLAIPLGVKDGSLATLKTGFKLAPKVGAKPPLTIKKHFALDKAPKVQSRKVLSNQKVQSQKVISSRKVQSRKVPSPQMSNDSMDVRRISSDDPQLKLHEIPLDQRSALPRLAHGLSRVLFNPGVYHLQDPRSRVYNFDPYLESIVPISDFDFDAVAEYTTSSQDTVLNELAKSQGKKYTGSTSSMTSVLSHFHYLLSSWRELSLANLSKNFPLKTSTFSVITRSPTVIFLRRTNGAYAVDYDREYDYLNILSMLGRSMEKFLTLQPDHFERYRLDSSNPLVEGERGMPETYHYSTLGDFLMRSQLDAHDPRLPGTGMFDLKTRAVLSIRMQANDHEQGLGYEIKDRFGEVESYEREYFDMIRSAFMKYSLQVRMGRMDGIFVAFHNVERVFGFQYISIDEMDAAIHGPRNQGIADKEFRLSVHLLNKVFDKVTERFPDQSVRLHFETRDTAQPYMYIFAEPKTEDEVNEIQTMNKARIREAEKALLTPKEQQSESAEEELAEDQDHVQGDDARWQAIDAGIEESMLQDEAEAWLANSDEVLLTDDQEAVAETSDESLSAQEVGEDSEISDDSAVSYSQGESGEAQTSEDIALQGEMRAAAAEDTEPASHEAHSKSSEPEQVTKAASEAPPGKETRARQRATRPATPILALILTAENLVNGHRVDRPDQLGPGDKWDVRYSFKEVETQRQAWALYQACQERRRKAVEGARKTQSEDDYFGRQIRELARRGRQYREELEEEEEKQGGRRVVTFSD